MMTYIGGKKNDLDFWTGVFAEIKGTSVLELACGTGRLAYSFIRDGANFTGIELCSDFADYAREKLNNVGNAPNILVGDMRSFKLNQKFDLIFIGFNSFLHLLSDADALSCLDHVKQHMQTNSRFLIDVFVPNPLFLYRPEGLRFNVLEYIDSYSDKKVFVDESSVYDPDTEINKITWYFSSKNNGTFAKEYFSMRMYFPSKMNQLLIDAGFKILHQWGDYHRTPLGTGSKLQIYDTCLA